MRLLIEGGTPLLAIHKYSPTCALDAEGNIREFPSTVDTSPPLYRIKPPSSRFHILEKLTKNKIENHELCVPRSEDSRISTELTFLVGVNPVHHMISLLGCLLLLRCQLMFLRLLLKAELKLNH